MEVGHALLTSAGKQLLAICGSQQSEPFYEYVIRRWSNANIVTSSFVPQKASG